MIYRCDIPQHTHMIFQGSAMAAAMGGVATATPATPPGVVDPHAHAQSQVYHYPTHHNNNTMMLNHESYTPSGVQQADRQTDTSVNAVNGTASDILQKVVRKLCSLKSRFMSCPKYLGKSKPCFISSPKCLGVNLGIPEFFRKWHETRYRQKSLG